MLTQNIIYDNDNYNHVLDAKGTIFSVVDIEQYIPHLEQFGTEQVKMRTRLKIKEKALARISEEALRWYHETYTKHPERKKITEYRWLEKDLPLSLAAEVMIYDDKVIGVLFKPGEKSAFEIQSQSFANSLKTVFGSASERW